MLTKDYSQITPEIENLAKIAIANNQIDPDLYSKYDVKRGLRDINGKGVLAGLTEISEIRQNKIVDGQVIPCDGQLFYRGINIENIIDGFINDGRFGFEEIVYLLLFAQLPNKNQLDEFNNLLCHYRQLPSNFVRDVIMKAPSNDMMNMLSRSVLTLFSYDSKANDTSIPNVMRQCIELIALFPVLSVYGYQAYNFYRENQSLVIHHPYKNSSTAENILHLLRPDSHFSPLEAKVLDMALVLHAEHGGGNNSSFTTHVVTSSGTDTYSAISAALASLKGPKHGGANIKVMQMFEDMKANVNNWQSESEVSDYLYKLVDKQAFDRSGLIYGMGHAVYSISDPRAKIFRRFVQKLSEEKHMQEEFALYLKVEELAPKVIADRKKIYKGVSANVDFFSGFAYKMLGLPLELYTPLFAIARIAGWSAHRLEELINQNKIIRPAYKAVCTETSYIKMSDRK